MTQNIIQVDAFTDAPFHGNPAAVCVLDTPQETAWMQLIAREMNLSETAFILKQEVGFNLRWFTPTTEVPLCGHATLASAYVLWTKFLKHNPKNPKWADRDRFVLSGGHASMLLYSLLYLTGYDVSLDDIKQFRQ